MFGSRATASVDDDHINPWLLGKSAEVDFSFSERIPGDGSQSMPGKPTGPTDPQRGRGRPEVVGAGLPIRTDRRRADTRLVVIGAHGGAGESRIAALHPTWHQAGHLFPDAADGPASVLLCCRTQVSGLLAAQAAAAQWAAGSVPWLRLLGLVITPDTPGRPPKAVRELARVIVGGVPRSWTLPWFEPWRLGEDPPTEHLPQPFRRLVLELDQLVGDDSCTQPRSGETSILEGSSDAQP